MTANAQGGLSLNVLRLLRCRSVSVHVRCWLLADSLPQDCLEGGPRFSGIDFSNNYRRRCSIPGSLVQIVITHME